MKKLLFKHEVADVVLEDLNGGNDYNLPSFFSDCINYRIMNNPNIEFSIGNSGYENKLYLLAISNAQEMEDAIRDAGYKYDDIKLDVEIVFKDDHVINSPLIYRIDKTVDHHILELNLTEEEINMLKFITSFNITANLFEDEDFDKNFSIVEKETEIQYTRTIEGSSVRDKFDNVHTEKSEIKILEENDYDPIVTFTEFEYTTFKESNSTVDMSPLIKKISKDKEINVNDKEYVKLNIKFREREFVFYLLLAKNGIGTILNKVVDDGFINASSFIMLLGLIEEDKNETNEDVEIVISVSSDSKLTEAFSKVAK